MKSTYVYLCIVSLVFLFFDTTFCAVETITGGKVHLNFINSTRFRIEVAMEGIGVRFSIKPNSGHLVELPMGDQKSVYSSSNVTVYETRLPSYTRVSIPADQTRNGQAISVESKMVSKEWIKDRTGAFMIACDPRPQFPPRLTVGPWRGGFRDLRVHLNK